MTLLYPESLRRTVALHAPADKGFQINLPRRHRHTAIECGRDLTELAARS